MECQQKTGCDVKSPYRAPLQLQAEAEDSMQNAKMDGDEANEIFNQEEDRKIFLFDDAS